MTYYKTLDGLDAVNGGSYTYPGVGRWTAHLDPDRLEPCGYGYHLAEDEQVLDWLGPTIYVAEPCGEHPPVNDGDKWVTCRVRLVRRTAWDERMARLFAADCAERVLQVYEAHCPGDSGPREATRVARAHAEGEATLDDLTAAWAAAGDAAMAAMAAGDAAVAAGDAAMAAMDAAGATPREAWAAASWAAWGAGARDGVWDAEAWDAWHAERAWQYQRLTHYLSVSAMRVRVEVAGGVWHASLTDTQGVPTVTLDPVGGVHSRWAVVDGFGRVDRLDRTRRWTADELEALALAVRRLTDHRPVPDVAGM